MRPPRCRCSTAMPGQVLDALLSRIDASPAHRGRQGARQGGARAPPSTSFPPPCGGRSTFLNMVRDALPDAIIVGDSTQAGLCRQPLLRSRRRARAGSTRRPATARSAMRCRPRSARSSRAPERPVVCLVGDGGLQFTLGELGSAIDAGAPIIVLVWNNRGYGEIKSYFREKRHCADRRRRRAAGLSWRSRAPMDGRRSGCRIGGVAARPAAAGGSRATRRR